MTAECSSRRFVVCSVCLGWGRVVDREPGGWRRTGLCPECNGTGEEVRVDEQAEAA